MPLFSFWSGVKLSEYFEPEAIAAFSSTEQACISKKIKKLIDEGKSKEQAAAIAISMCAPEKAKSSGELDIKMTKETDSFRVEGVAYSGGKMKLGGWDHPVVVDLSGMSIAETTPMLTDHENNVGKRIGIATATTDGKSISFEGKIFRKPEEAEGILAQLEAGADWQLSIGAEVKEEKFIKAGESVEINGVEHVGPFYWIKKSNLREISVVAVGADVSTRMKIAASFVLFGGSHMPKDIKAEGNPDEKKPDEKKDEKDEKKPVEGEAISAIKASLDSLTARIAAIEEKVGIKGEKKDDEEKDKGPASGGDSQPAEMSAKAAATIKGQYEARIFSLEKRDAERENDKKVADLVASAKKELAGWHVDDQLVATLSQMAKAGKDVLDGFVAEHKRRTPKDPPAGEEGIEARLIGGSDEEATEAVAFLSTFGPKFAEAARKHMRTYLTLKAAGFSPSDPREHILVQMRAEGMDTARIEKTMKKQAVA